MGRWTTTAPSITCGRLAATSTIPTARSSWATLRICTSSRGQPSTGWCPWSGGTSPVPTSQHGGCTGRRWLPSPTGPTGTDAIPATRFSMTAGCGRSTRASARSGPTSRFSPRYPMTGGTASDRRVQVVPDPDPDENAIMFRDPFVWKVRRTAGGWWSEPATAMAGQRSGCTPPRICTSGSVSTTSRVCPARKATDLKPVMRGNAPKFLT